jgi:type VII secretion-associated serine protease mycosin
MLLGLPLGLATPARADTSSQWPLQYLKAEQIWNITKGSGTTVAVLDTGVASIPDTQSNLLSGADYTSGASSSTGNGETDLDGHGTSMAVLIAGKDDTLEGLAPGAEILPVRILTTTGGVGGADIVAAGVRFAISKHVSAINLSQYVTSPDANLAAAIQAAEAANIVVVAASGNRGASTINYPAAYPGVVAVGAVNQSGSLWSGSNAGPQLTLTAPGAGVPVEDDTGAVATVDGTSVATAYVAAAVALIRAAHPSWTAGQVIRDLISTTDPASGQPAGQHSDEYGYGIVDPLKALQAPAPTETSNPLLAATGGSTTSATPTATGATVGPRANGSSSTSHFGLVIALVLGAVAVIFIIIFIIVLSRKNKNRPKGPGSHGGGQVPYGPVQQQSPYYGQAPAQQQYPPDQYNPPRP